MPPGATGGLSDYAAYRVDEFLLIAAGLLRHRRCRALVIPIAIK